MYNFNPRVQNQRKPPLKGNIFRIRCTVLTSAAKNYRLPALLLKNACVQCHLHKLVLCRAYPLYFTNLYARL